VKIEVDIQPEKFMAEELKEAIEMVHNDLINDRFIHADDKPQCQRLLPALIEVWKYYTVPTQHGEIEQYQIEDEDHTCCQTPVEAGDGTLS